MKKLILIIAIVVAPIMSFGQQSVFDKFEDMQGVSSVVVNQKMFKMLADIQINVDDPEANELLAMIEKITSLKVLTTGDENISKQMNESVAKYLKTANLQELMRMKDGDQTVNFYVKEGKDDNHVKELLMFVNGLKELTKGQDVTINGKKREIETVVLSLTGDIDLKQISKLTSKMNIPGGQQLEKAGKAKKQ
ncbi:DUF4252 domain-containing protein [Aquaticitalea lipolytica]|jgi:hypothetical protein|uniref:DUF4252 domain-containing protein n=1 Tax=Aquaticitalea lipolytica TaxID=1247562 RepID=UPI0024B88EC2|nr:DUF4252 domain-containing protein [Aquaticitalea lipolytica]